MRKIRTSLCLALSIFSLVVLGAPPALAAHAFEMTIVPPTSALGYTVYRVDIATGVVTFIDSQGQYAKTADPDPIPQGDYHLKFTQAADGKTYWIYRMDSQTGRTWSLVGTTWTATPEPK
jgi:hypothetical protein